MFHTNTCIHKQILTPEQNLYQHNMILQRIRHFTSYVLLLPRSLPAFIYLLRQKQSKIENTFLFGLPENCLCSWEKLWNIVNETPVIVIQFLFVAGRSHFCKYTEPKNCVFVLKQNDSKKKKAVTILTKAIFHTFQLQGWATKQWISSRKIILTTDPYL